MNLLLFVPRYNNIIIGTTNEIAKFYHVTSSCTCNKYNSRTLNCTAIVVLSSIVGHITACLHAVPSDLSPDGDQGLVCKTNSNLMHTYLLLYRRSYLYDQYAHGRTTFWTSRPWQSVLNYLIPGNFTRQ